MPAHSTDMNASREPRVGAAAKMHAKWKQQHESYGAQINEKYIQRGAAATQEAHRKLLKARGENKHSPRASELLKDGAMVERAAI